LEEEMNNEKLKVINLFAGPGAGKSTTRAGLFHKMKSEGMNVEEVTEYAKDITWDETQVLLSDQLFMLANQNRRLTRLRSKVDLAISDSPLMLTINYVPHNYLPENFKKLTMELWDTYHNFNFFIEREKKYNPIGRNQTEEEARQIDENILKMLKEYKVPFLRIKGDHTAVQAIYDQYMGLDKVLGRDRDG
jgi:tRNA uridine 5-carbamoylmethylation protein Kti12